MSFLATSGLSAQASTVAPGIDLGDWTTENANALARIVPAMAGTLDAAADTVAVPAPAATGEERPGAGQRLRKLLADFSMTLRNIRYRHGGSDPKTGFDCSGFVRYVFEHSVGARLPVDSASQYRAGYYVSRSDMKVGDLVFFRIRGQRISHVGIYLGDGRFIHSPSTGKRVSISSLDETYWSHHFAGAKRPDVLG